MAIIQHIATCLIFNNQAEEAVKFYTSIFKDSRIQKIALYGNSAYEFQEIKPNTVMTIVFELNGQTFIAANMGAGIPVSEGISLQLHCKNQEEIDYYWENLSEGADAGEQKSGWIKDKFGICWQIVPNSLIDMITDQDTDKSQRVLDAMMSMKKLNINDLKRAYLGKSLH